VQAAHGPHYTVELLQRDLTRLRVFLPELKSRLDPAKWQRVQLLVQDQLVAGGTGAQPAGPVRPAERPPALHQGAHHHSQHEEVGSQAAHRMQVAHWLGGKSRGDVVGEAVMRMRRFAVTPTRGNGGGKEPGGVHAHQVHAVIERRAAMVTELGAHGRHLAALAACRILHQELAQAWTHWRERYRPKEGTSTKMAVQVCEESTQELLGRHREQHASLLAELSAAHNVHEHRAAQYDAMEREMSHNQDRLRALLREVDTIAHVRQQERNRMDRVEQVRGGQHRSRVPHANQPAAKTNKKTLRGVGRDINWKCIRGAVVSRTL